MLTIKNQGTIKLVKKLTKETLARAPKSKLCSLFITNESPKETGFGREPRGK